MYLPWCWEQNSVTSHQNRRTISRTQQTAENLSTDKSLLKIYNQTLPLVDLHMMKCLGKGAFPSSIYFEISPLPNSLAKQLAKAHGSNVLLGNEPLLCPLSLSPAAFTSLDLVLNHTVVLLNCFIIFGTTDERKGFSLPLILWVPTWLSNSGPCIDNPIF